MSDGQHSYLPPSGAEAWSQCAMWPTMNAKYPKQDTPESMEGNAAHWVFAEMLAGHAVNEGDSDPAGTIITEEMIEGGQFVVDFVAPRIPNFLLNVEKSVAIKRIHEKCWGTPDIWAYHEESFILDIIDYKFGHRFVDEFENKQGIGYAAGIIDLLAAKLGMGGGQLDQLITIRFTVIQPRCFYKGSPVRTWTVKGDDLRGHINQLANAANAACDPLTPERTATTNSECGDCPGKYACEALQLAAYSDAEFAVTSSPVELPPLAAGLELKMMERSLERLQARVEGLRENVAMYIKQGHAIPWYRAEQGYGRQQWTLPNEQIVAMGYLMGVDLTKPGVKTPKQAEKSGIDASVIKAYSINPPGSIKLVATNPSDARRVFGLTR